MCSPMSIESGNTVAAEVLVETASHLPASPQVLAELNELLLDPHLRLDDVVALLRRDAALAWAVVKVANSPLFPGARAVSVDDAVSRIGLTEVFRAVSLATTARYAAITLPCYGVIAGRLGKNALLHALAAQALAPMAGIEASAAYTAGLVRSLGLMVINQLVRDRCDPTRPVLHSRDLLQAEREWVGMNNGEVAATVLEHWRFAPEITQAIREHYLLQGWQNSTRLAVVLNVAGAITVALGGALRAEQDVWIANPAKLAWLGVTEEQLLAAQESVQEQFKGMRFAVE